MGGGKSDALLMGGLQFVDYPGYAALILRRSYADLSLPGALIERARNWLQGRARWRDAEHTWYFPSGATISFGYLERENDIYRYASSEFQYIAFDELTQFELNQYRFLFSRLRRLAGSPVPLRVRGATNPIGPGERWVQDRFVVPDSRGNDRIFIPSFLEDNPSLDIKEYESSLAELDPVTRLRLRRGLWGLKPEGGMFKEQWVQYIDQEPEHLEYVVRRWDMASTEPSESNPDPDYTVGVLLGYASGRWYTLDAVWGQKSPAGVEELISATARRDGLAVPVRLEQEPGASGAHVVDHYVRSVLPGYDVQGKRSSGDKAVRAGPLASACENGNWSVLRRWWSEEYVAQFLGFPFLNHDDFVDATSGAMADITNRIHAEPDMSNIIMITAASKWTATA